MRIKASDRPKSENAKMVFFIIIYRIILDLIYTNQLSRIFRYTGFNSQFDILLFALSWFLLALSIPMIKRCTYEDEFSDVIMLFLIYLSYIPFTTMVAYYNYSWQFILANSTYWLVFFVSFRYLPHTAGKIGIRTDNKEKILLFIEAVFGVAIIYISWRYTGFRFTISLADVYTYRAEARMASMPTILSYIFAASKAINPVLLVYSLKRRNYWNSAFIIILQILSYSINGSKTVFFSTVSAVILFFIYDRKYLKRIPDLLSAVTLISFLETAIFHSIFVLSYFVRRVLFLPNQLGYLYFDFFSKNEPDYYRQSFLRLFGFSSPYEDIDHVIGGEYFNRFEMGANNGLISDAITNWGIVGIIVMPVILVIVLRFLDKCASGIDKRIYIVTSVTFAFIIMSSFLPTVLLTHGLLALSLVLMILPRETDDDKQMNEL